MTAVAHASPAEIRRLVAVRTGGFVPTDPARRTAAAAAATYRRRRIAAALVAAAAVAVLALGVHGLLVSFGGGPLTASERPGAPGTVYVVQPGDTFWDLARRLRPHEDPRPLVAQMVAAHGSPVLMAGERLRLPERA